MDGLTAFGLFAVTAMLVTYSLEGRSLWFVLAFAGACALGSAYGFLQGAWPFGVVEAVWACVAARRFVSAHSGKSPRGWAHAGRSQVSAGARSQTRPTALTDTARPSGGDRT